ncbi:uncharacterized protein LOC126900249 [Daktulosphaira vitifoliae]|uniref:uncharacterized protein LOC126900249 n=1 Tax=Daktulosphaira vitifoliae TaxID=58002 RepID=UPI0021A984B9|nr:uncharacterized protein LOC126900249 [Daktulosphaira vitifoliae]
MARFLYLLLSAALIAFTYALPMDSSEHSSPAESSNDMSLIEQLQHIIEKRDISMDVAGATVVMSPKKMEDNEMGLTFKLPNAAEARGKRHKLKKILMPIMVFIMLKALTLIPLAIGVLGLKAWNALQLSFFSFVLSIGLAIFQLVRKAGESPPALATHDAGIYSAPSAHYARSMQDNNNAHEMAFINQLRR